MTESAASPPFPPDSIEAFLRLCAGEWMTLRSRFELGDSVAGEHGDEWHASERGELLVTYLEPGSQGDGAGGSGPGGLSVGPRGGPVRRLRFAHDGSFHSQGMDPGRQGRWQLRPDGSLELVIREGTLALSERIWFTKPNLRLRSTLECHADGTPGRASFSSEIRRLSRPADPPAT